MSDLDEAKTTTSADSVGDVETIQQQDSPTDSNANEPNEIKKSGSVKCEHFGTTEPVAIESSGQAQTPKEDQPAYRGLDLVDVHLYLCF